MWPSAYASGALVKCRKVGAANWGNSKKEEVEVSGDNLIEMGTPTPAERIRDTKKIGTPPTKGGDSQRKEDSLPKPEKTTPEPKKPVKPVISGAKAAIGVPPSKKGLRKGLRYNPYGKGATANPSNMSSTTGP